MKFVMNDKCSAGTGKFLEVMTNRLGLTQNELSELASRQDVTNQLICVRCLRSPRCQPYWKGNFQEDIA